MHTWRIKLIEVNFHNHPVGSVLTVGEDINESGACYLLECGNAVPVDDMEEQIQIGGIDEEILHFHNDDLASDNIGSGN